MARAEDTGPRVALGAAIAVYVAVFGVLTWRQQSNYGTFGYDMGLHDQGIWLTSRFFRPFDTIRGMHYFGHHVNLVSLLYVPAYWLGAGPHFLYLSETVILALGAIPVWLLARRRLASGWLALVPAVALLLHPSIEWMNWWHWHPEALAVTPLLFAWWFATERRWRWFAFAIALALSTKEDIALAVMMLGAVLVMTGRARDRRFAGAATAVAGLSWFAICTRLIIPPLLEGAPFYERQLFGDFGTSLGSVLVGMVTHPAKVASMATAADRLTYYVKLLGPLGFVVPLLGLPFLLIAGPQLGVNVLSTLPGTHDIRFQYSAAVVAAIFIATVEGLGLLRRVAPRFTRIAVATLIVSALVANIAWSPSPLGRDFDTGIWARRTARHDTFDKAVSLVPKGAGVAASYYLIPHLTHRRFAYEWPNPFILGNWGVNDEHPPDGRTAEYLVLDTVLGQEPALLERLTRPGGDYDVILDEDGVVVARRRAR